MSKVLNMSEYDDDYSGKEACECHGRLLESWFPQFSVISRCIPDQPEGVHDETSEAAAIPKIRKLAKEFEKQGVDGVIISCCGGSGVGTCP